MYSTRREYIYTQYIPIHIDKSIGQVGGKVGMYKD